MAAVKLQKFLGIYPKLSPEHLPETGAQVAKDIKFYSGDLIPYKESIAAGTLDYVFSSGSTNPITTIYSLTASGVPPYWVGWKSDTDIVELPDTSFSNLRILFTSTTGTPRVTTARLLREDLPSVNEGRFVRSYFAGVVPPSEPPIVIPVPIETLESTHYSRDDNNIATFYTEESHNLAAGNIISIVDFGTSDQAERFNAKDVEVREEGLEDTEFTYFNPGDEVDKQANTTGRATLAGLTQLRTYVYTCVNLWGEESLPSPPSEPVRVKGGQSVSITGLPASDVDKLGDVDIPIRGIKLYRSVVTASATDYFLLDTLWFPITTYIPTEGEAPESLLRNYLESERITFIREISNRVEIRFSNLFPSNRVVGDMIYVEAEYRTNTDIGFNRVLCKVTSSSRGGISIKADIVSGNFDGGDADVKANLDNRDSYHVVRRVSFGFNTKTDLDATGDTASIYGIKYKVSVNDGEYLDNLELPSGAEILPSEQYDVPHLDMVGVTIAHNNIYAGFFDDKLCLSFPNKPHAWPESYRIPIEETIVAIASVSGYIVVLTTGYPYLVTGNDPATMVPTRSDTFYPCLSKRSVVIMPYGVVWATHGGLATFSLNGGVRLVTGALHDWDTWPIAIDIPTLIGGYYEGKYLGSHSRGAFVFERDDNSGGTLTAITATFAAAYLDSDTGIVMYIQPDDRTNTLYQFDPDTGDNYTLTWRSKVIIAKDPTNFGACKIVADYTEDSVVTFRLFVDKKQVSKFILVTSDEVFRLPMGYRSDTFEVEITSNVRVRSIHLSSTPMELRGV